jgi:hypothetical protein
MESQAERQARHLCREVLFHLSFEDGRAALSDMSKAARWLIATTDPHDPDSRRVGNVNLHVGCQ